MPWGSRKQEKDFIAFFTVTLRMAKGLPIMINRLHSHGW